jgi:hypothetical protein
VGLRLSGIGATERITFSDSEGSTIRGKPKGKPKAKPPAAAAADVEKPFPWLWVLGGLVLVGGGGWYLYTKHGGKSPLGFAA